MNYPPQNQFANRSSFGGASRTGEDTLHLIASLPAPEGLEDRIHAGLRAGQLSARRTGRVLSWPSPLRPGREWMRAAAAAAIAFVVAGGGWGIYSRVQTGSPAKAIAMPRIAAPGGFSSAGTMRTPNTLSGPVLTHPLTVQPPHSKASTKSSAPALVRHGKGAARPKAAAQPAAPSAQ